MTNNTMSEEDKLLVEIQNIDNHQGVPLKNRITANEMKQILELAKRYTLSKQIEARIDERENMKFFDNGGHGAEIHLPYVEYRYTGDGLKLTWDDRTEELRKQQEGLR